MKDIDQDIDRHWQKHILFATIPIYKQSTAILALRLLQFLVI